MMKELSQLNQRINNCKKCSLWEKANQAVPGEGPANAKVMLVGQNPGAEEDKTGRPFVGRAGQYLNKILEKNDLVRKKMFITSVVKHKSPNNRKPTNEEIESCLPFLIEQIGIIAPKIIVLLGNVAQKIPREEKITYLETYHPAAAMRFPRFRKKFEIDFKKLASISND
jgi:DNA polymerase